MLVAGSVNPGAGPSRRTPVTPRMADKDCSQLLDDVYGSPVTPGLRAFAVPFRRMATPPQCLMSSPRCRFSSTTKSKLGVRTKQERDGDATARVAGLRAHLSWV